MLCCVFDASEKSIDCEGLEESRTEARQNEAYTPSRQIKITHKFETKLYILGLNEIGKYWSYLN